MRKDFFKNENGFTIGELMIVVAIISVLVSVSIPTFARLQKKAQDDYNDATSQAWSDIDEAKRIRSITSVPTPTPTPTPTPVEDPDSTPTPTPMPTPTPIPMPTLIPTPTPMPTPTPTPSPTVEITPTPTVTPVNGGAINDGASETSKYNTFYPVVPKTDDQGNLIVETGDVLVTKQNGEIQTKYVITYTNSDFETQIKYNQIDDNGGWLSVELNYEFTKNSSGKIISDNLYTKKDYIRDGSDRHLANLKNGTLFWDIDTQTLYVRRWAAGEDAAPVAGDGNWTKVNLTKQQIINLFPDIASVLE